jgi:hypothetical protein
MSMLSSVTLTVVSAAHYGVEQGPKNTRKHIAMVPNVFESNYF